MPKISAEDFVKAWQTSESVKEVCAKLNCEEQQAYVRSKALRDKGVPLKKFNHNGLIDYAALAKLAEELA